ncbi:MAG: peptide chain release factor 1 [Planctomycetes bacterium]|nr:peptide chain release factor 1 [Planctomycetota bacterium]
MLLPRLLRAEERFSQIDVELAAGPIEHARLATLMKERGSLAPLVELVRGRRRLLEDLQSAEELLAADASFAELANEARDAAHAQLPSIENRLVTLFVSRTEQTPPGLIVEIRAGTGGDEAALFAGELLRMYMRFCERRGLKAELLDESHTELGGVREAVLGVSGEAAWAAFKFESGGHRVQRVPSTETQGRVHTSAATVAVLPEPDEAAIVINDGDLRIDSFRSSGPGGQSVNKTSSAIRITHIPTGTVVSCQDEKSQHKNKARALKILRARLHDLEAQRLHSERSGLRRVLIGSGDRSERIRTYNFPQDRVTDHRIGASFHDLPCILAGGLDALIEALAQSELEARLKALAEEKA